MSKHEKKRRKLCIRSEDFKTRYPNIPDVPDELHAKTAIELRERHNLGPPTTSKERTEEKELQNQKRRATRLRKHNPDIPDIPMFLTKAEASRMFEAYPRGGAEVGYARTNA